MRSGGRSAALGDDRVEQSAGAARAVGQFGGEGGVAAGDSALAQQCGQREVGVGVALGHRAQHVERRAAGRVERLRRGRCGFVTVPSLALRTRRVGHRAPSRRRPSASCPAAGRCPAAPAAMRCRRARRLRSTRITPGGNGFGAASSTVTGPSLTRRSPIIVHAPGFGVTGADPPLDDVRGQIPAHPGLVDGDLRRDASRRRPVAAPASACRRRCRPASSPAAPHPTSTAGPADRPRCRSGRTVSVTTP